MNKVLQGFVNMLRRSNSSEVKIEYPADHYTITLDPKENLLKFEEALKIIKEKCKVYNFEAAFQQKFGEEFSFEDFQYPERIDAYCMRNNVSKESINEFKRERLKIKEIGNRIVYELITHAEGLLYYRGDVCPDYMLSKLARIEGERGNKASAAEFKKMLEDVRKNNTKIKEGAKFTLLRNAANSISINAGPYGKEPVNQHNWGRVVDLVAEKLRARGIDIIENGHNKEMWEIFSQVNEQLRKEKSEGFELEQGRAEDQIIKDIEEATHEEATVVSKRSEHNHNVR